MIKSLKIRLLPTEEQNILMFKSTGIARFTYNWGLNRWQELHDNGEKTSVAGIKKEFNNTIKKDQNYKWLYEVSGQITAQAFKDLGTAFNNFFKGTAKYPNFKSKRKSKKSFYVRYDAITFKDGTVNLEKIGKVKYSTNYKIPNLPSYVNPRCHFDGKYWCLSFGYEQNENQVKLNKNLSIGIDLGIKDLAICSNGITIKNINKTAVVTRLEKRLKRLKRQVSRKYDKLKKGKIFKKGEYLIKTQNIIKLERKIKLIYRRLTNIRNNHIHQATNKIIKFYPHRIVMEDLNISGLMKNKHLAKSIQEQKFFEFVRQIKYKCEFNGIEFIQADMFYPSSKTCSNCGSIKKDLKLKDRVYKCSCGLSINRDLNASINLSKYKLV